MLLASRAKGLVLLVVIGVLGVLAILGTTFVTMASLERRASQQRIHASRASLLARSGLEDALARLQAGQEGLLDAAPFLQGSFGLGHTYALTASTGGFFVNGGDPACPPDEGYNAVLRRLLGTLAEAVDRDVLAGVMQADDGLPVDQADGEKLITLRPPGGWTSFQEIRDLAFAADPLELRQRKLDALRPYLVLEAWVDRQVIRPNFDPPGGTLYYQGATEIRKGHRQDVLGSHAPGFETLRGRNVGRAPVDFSWARRHRPALIALLAGLKGFYQDETAATPWSLANRSGILRSVEIRNDWNPLDDCHALADRILSAGGELSDWEEFHAFCDSLPIPSMEAALPAAEVALGPARAALDAARSALDAAQARCDADPTEENAEALWAAMDAADMAQWDLDALLAVRNGLAVTVPTIVQAMRDLLKANFNPNTDLNKCNPNSSLWKSVDKSDLLVYSTELSLRHLQAVDLECIGRVVDGGGRLLAARTLRTRVSPPCLVRLSTQRDFVAESLGSPLFGDEGGVRLPGQDDFLSLSRGPGLERTWGHRLPGMGQGAALQSYPEPCVSPFGALLLNPADYDGNLQLATVETEAGDAYGVAPSADLKCLASFDDGFDLDAADGPRPCQAFEALLGTAALGNGLFQSSGFNTLHPDGAYSETQRVPAYAGRGNLHGFHGVLSFWVKPDYRALIRGNRSRPYFMATGAGAGERQFFFLGDDDGAYDPKGGLRLQYEIGNRADDTGREHVFMPVDSRSKPHRWTLVTAAWDSLADTKDATGEVILDNGVAGKTGSIDTYGGGNFPADARDLTGNAGAEAHLISLGPLRRRDYTQPFEVNWVVSGGADATLDEFAIWDFGGAPLGGGPVPQPSLDAPGILAGNRYRSGRYYKGAAYRRIDDPVAVDDEAPSWLSPPIHLPAGAILRTASWTWYHPAELPDDYAGVELVDSTQPRYLWNDASAARATQAPRWAPERREWTIGRMAPAEGLRVRVVFQRVRPLGGDPANTPILDSPVLDDLTLLYDPPGGPRLSSWGA